jgi:hypothetical protein
MYLYHAHLAGGDQLDYDYMSSQPGNLNHQSNLESTFPEIPS